MGKLGWEWCRVQAVGGHEEGTALQYNALSRTNSCYLGVGVCQHPSALCGCTCGCTQRRVFQPLICWCSAQRNICVGRSFRMDLWFLTAVLAWGKKKKKKRGVLHNCQSRGNNSPLADFILSSLDEHKPCSRVVRGVCLMCICQLRAQSGKAVSRKVSTRTSFSLWTAQSDWVNLSAQTGKQGKKSIVPEAQSPTSCSNWCWVLERWQENVGKIFTVLCNVRSSFFLFS